MSAATPFIALAAATAARRREQWLAPERIRARRARRLRRLAEAAWRTRYYRKIYLDLGLGPHDLDESALPRFPLLEKSVLHAASERGMLARRSDELFPVTTSGSTGQPLKVLRSVRDQAGISALWARILHAYGHRIFDDQVNVNTGKAVAQRGPVAALRRLGVLPEITHLSSFEPVDRQVEILRARRPRTFSAYAISLEMIAERILELGITDVRPRLIFSAAMPLSDRGRELAREAFGVDPLDVYVAAELGPLAWECPTARGALHLNDDTQIIEIIDAEGNVVPDGEPGEVVVTQLGCLAQPLLRYRLGDIAARLPGRCGCGRGLALLSPVQGRTRHVIRTPDGRVLYGMMVSTVVKPFVEVRRWQLRQTAPNVAELLVVPGGGWRPEVGTAIARQLSERFGPLLRFEVVPVDDIPLAPTGKLQTIVPLPDEILAATS